MLSLLLQTPVFGRAHTSFHLKDFMTVLSLVWSRVVNFCQKMIPVEDAWKTNSTKTVILNWLKLKTMGVEPSSLKICAGVSNKSVIYDFPKKFCLHRRNLWELYACLPNTTGTMIPHAETRSTKNETENMDFPLVKKVLALKPNINILRIFQLWN